jgi:hypothetical protein
LYKVQYIKIPVLFLFPHCSYILPSIALQIVPPISFLIHALLLRLHTNRYVFHTSQINQHYPKTSTFNSRYLLYTMKHLILTALVFVFFLSAASKCSKHKNRENVPDVVVEEFDKEHEDAGKVHWEPKDDHFEARFVENDVERVVVYAPSGKRVRMEYVVQEKDVPVVVVTRLRKKHPELTIEHITYVEKPSKKPFYIARVRHPQALSNIEISLAGVILRTVVLESFVVKVNQVHFDHDDDDCDDHKHKHKHKKHKHKGRGHGHCKHDDHHGGNVIQIKLKN